MLALKKLSPTRLIRNDFFRAVEEAENRGATAEELQQLLGRGRSKRGIFEGDLTDGELEIGQAASLIRELPTAGQIVRETIAEYESRQYFQSDPVRQDSAGRSTGHLYVPRISLEV